MGMDSAIFGVFNFLICLFDEYMFFMFWDTFLECKIKSKNKKALIVVFVALMIFTINCFDSSLLNLISVFVIHIGLCIILYQADLKRKIFFSLTCCILLIFVEFVLVCIAKFEVLLHIVDIREDLGKRLIAIIFTKLIAFLFIKRICRLAVNSKNDFFYKEAKYFYVLPIPCLVLYIGIDYSHIKFSYLDISSLVILCGCVLLLFAVGVQFLLYERMTAIVKRINEFEIVSLKNKLEQEHYERVEEINFEHRKLLHSINDYLSAIKALACENHSSEILRITQDFNEHVVELKEANYCDDAIMNAILKEKEWEARRQGIRYEAFVEPGFCLPEMSAIDLISILSNPLNNAIEAATDCDKGFITIQFYRANEGKFSIFKVKNNFERVPICKEGIFVSQKDNNEEHGIGIEQTESLVENYGGIMETTVEGKEFTTTVMFFM